VHNHAAVLEWAINCLAAKGYFLKDSPQVLLETPWSTLIRCSTTKGDVYLKQMPATISLEAQIIQLLREQFHASVPVVIASNEKQHCFLMESGGQSLRQYLKTTFNPALLYESIKQYTSVQRSTEHHECSFFELDVPDWRLDKLPELYDHLMNQEDFLKEESLTDNELDRLRQLSPQFLAQCSSLAQYEIPSTLVQYDFNTNNILIDPKTKKLSFIDLGEIVIAHPFFSLHTFFYQASIHHGVTEFDPLYNQLQDVCFENWLNFMAKDQLLAAFMLAKKLWPIYSALCTYRLMINVDIVAFKQHYAEQPYKLAAHLRGYLAAS